MPRKILIPLDGTELAEQVVPFVGEIAKAGGYDVSLLTVIDPAGLDVIETAGEGIISDHDTGSGGGKGMDLAYTGTGGMTGLVWMTEIGSPAELSKHEAAALDEANKNAREYLSGIERKLEDMGVNTDTLLGFGNPDREIVDEAIKSGATTIAMSARSASFWERGALGTTTNRVIHASPMPVIVFKPMAGLADAISVNPDTIVLAVDGSKQCERSIGPAAELAKNLGAKLVLVHVLHRDRGRRRERAEEYLQQLSGKIDGEVEVRVLTGAVDDEVILFADQFNHPLIALTEHGGISIGRWFRGSNTDKVIRNAGYPVLIIPANE